VVSAAEVVIRCEGLGKRFGGAWVLKEVGLEVRAGEVLGLIGPGGHGKSTLLKLFAGLLKPDAGRVLFRGKDLAKLNSTELSRAREEVGYLFQNYALFDFLTVSDNVAFPLRMQRKPPPEEEIQKRVLAILGAVGLGHALGLFPNELSGGMKKRVGLARAAVTHPPVGLYDDPTAGLDPVTSSKIFRLVEQMFDSIPGAAMVVASHDIDRMKVVCHRYAMVYETRLLFAGVEADIPKASPVVGDFFYGALNKAAGIVT
jgi:phospholipid/cholesterol/gamma-HCH transport system ATP-binding protein